MKDILKKLYKNYIVRNLLILFIIFFFLFYGTLVILRHYTHHGEALSVPDVRGMTINEANQLLSGKKLRYQLSDSVYVTTSKPGTVVSQNPEPDSKVKENRNVFLTINAMLPEKVKMPNVVGVSFRQAKTMLESNGLNVGKLTYIPDIAKNNVLKQYYKGAEIKKGVEVVKGSDIDLILGQGLSDERTNVPNLIGLGISDAREYLTKYYLNLGVIIYDNSVLTSSDSIKAFIWQQNPVADIDALIQLGATIDVWLTVDENQNPAIIHSESDGKDVKKE